MYCIKTNKIIWEYETHNQLSITKVRPFLLEFGVKVRKKLIKSEIFSNLNFQNEKIALSFNFEDDASEFLYIVTKTVAIQRKKREGEKIILNF